MQSLVKETPLGLSRSPRLLFIFSRDLSRGYTKKRWGAPAKYTQGTLAALV